MNLTWFNKRKVSYNLNKMKPTNTFSTDLSHYDVIIVGAGLSGSVIARECACQEQRVLMIDKRDHIAGNCYDKIDPQTNILISQYGAHLFHTNSEQVWNYVQSFASWMRWDHKVVSMVQGNLVPIPVNIQTINHIFNLHLTEDEVDSWFTTHTKEHQRDLYENSKQVAISRVGEELYELLFANYTYKQWEKHGEDLEPEVLARIPVRKNYDERYFTDKYQALPVGGYTQFVNRILDHPNIDIKLQTDWSQIKDLVQQHQTIVFTGRIDCFFEGHGLPPLEYRSLQFEWKHLPDQLFQPNSVVNYPGFEFPFTRIVEYKHFYHQYNTTGTVISVETSCDDGEPYYPVPTAKNRELYEKYKQLTKQAPNVHFVGRLASYKYFNMDGAILNALTYFEQYLKKQSSQ